MPEAGIESISVISRAPDLYHGWPTVARRSNGELLVGYSGGREHHVCPFGRNELMRSGDDGQTWSDPVVLNDSVLDDRDVGVLETSKGAILVNWFDSLAWLPQFERAKEEGGWPEEKLLRWQEAYDRIPQELLDSGAGQSWMLRSTDGGESWDGPHKIPVNACHGPVEISGGRLLFAGKGTSPVTGEHCIGSWQSTDDGRTWEFTGEMPAREGDTSRDYHELHPVESADGTLIAHVRNHNKANASETLQTESKDGGKTWSAPRAIGVWGLPSFLLRLRDDRLLMTYGHRRPPFGNQARLSADNGQTWSEPLVVSDDGPSGDLGYPSTVELGDGTLLTIWYELMEGSPRAVLRQARWTIDG